MSVWFTAETHFGYRNVLTLSRRPFADIGEHDEILVANWNARVGRQDEVWHLGDFALGLDEKVLSCLFGRLNGRTNLIVGSHDSRHTLRLPWALRPRQVHEVVIDGRASCFATTRCGAGGGSKAARCTSTAIRTAAFPAHATPGMRDSTLGDTPRSRFPICSRVWPGSDRLKDELVRAAIRSERQDDSATD